MADAGQPSPLSGTGTAWFGSELSARIASGAVLAAVALLATWYGGWPFAVLWLLAGSAIAYEWLAMAGAHPLKPLAIAAIGTLVALLVAMLWLPPVWAAAVGAGGGIVLCLVAAGPRDRVWALAGLLYAAVLVLAMPLLREERSGLVIILWMFAVVWASDIAGYFAGRRFGGPKLWPAVSPGKTWSGAVAGTLAGSAAGLLVVWSAGTAARESLPVGLGAVTVASALASIAGQLGDLGESALKRHAGAKDSGRLIPGHGGVMDRLDALWAVALLAGGGLAGSRLLNP